MIPCNAVAKAIIRGKGSRGIGELDVMFLMWPSSNIVVRRDSTHRGTTYLATEDGLIV